MALEIKGAVSEGCLELSYTDRTGLYNNPGNITGYGSENGVTGPAAFDTYTLKVWYPESDLTADPDFTYDLQTAIPTPDSDDYYTWEITVAEMGLTKLISGVYTFMATGTLGQSVYIADVVKYFTRDLKLVIDQTMVEWDPTCGCSDGCEDPSEVYAAYLTVSCDGVCSAQKAQEIITALYDRSANCC